MITEAVLLRLESFAMSSYDSRLCAHYVDDTLDIIERDDLSSFQLTLNSVFWDIQFTVKEVKLKELQFMNVLTLITKMENFRQAF